MQQQSEHLVLPETPPAEPATTANWKPTNPKDLIGLRRPRSWISVSWHVLREVSVAMLEGAFKYGRHNYRPAGVLASIYCDAAIDHITRFWEGQDNDPDVTFVDKATGRKVALSHITKAITSLIVLRDSMITGNWVDDRPVVTVGDDHRADMQIIVDGLFEKYPEPKKPFTQKEMK